ncbi:MAG: bifunctional proline dehydrogenase/L-glutamate gamma-semialdehyde dehydrogenase PutA [Pseudomonadota bacterium]
MDERLPQLFLSPLSSDERETLRPLRAQLALDTSRSQRVCKRAEQLVEDIRANASASVMEVFLAEYGLSTDEGVALMCLAEALLRVPDAETIDELIEDKIAASAWNAHLGQSSSSLVNASTWALLLTGTVLTDQPEGVAGALRAAVRRLGEPLIRTAVAGAMRHLGAQFVLGRDISEALERSRHYEANGYTFSYDMLGEGARTDADARRYHLAYASAIVALSEHGEAGSVRDRPGISVKLSALHPRYEPEQRDKVMSVLLPRVTALAMLARGAGIGFNIDAEETERLELSLAVIGALAREPALTDWDGLGVVVQAYGRRARDVIDWLYALAGSTARRIMVRLVKGAYWDTEIKRAQVEGLEAYPVFTRKAATDVAYLACARSLLARTDRLYPQFATHNAHTVAAILELAESEQGFEFQRLHGMGEALHAEVRRTTSHRCRIYAPVGAHRDLLAYLVRRLLENGANSSFVNQMVDPRVPAEKVAADPLAVLDSLGETADWPALPLPRYLYAPERMNASGWDLRDLADARRFDAARAPWRTTVWSGKPEIAGAAPVDGPVTVAVTNPARPEDRVGSVEYAVDGAVDHALADASIWNAPVGERAAKLRHVADAYEAATGELSALLHREAGKTPHDAIAEIREAVDFLHYYAAEAERHSRTQAEPAPRGRFVCISPWNFPLAIFTGQIAAALAAGNAVVAKPAEETTLIAARAVQLMHRAGIPTRALQLLPGPGETVGRQLVSDSRVNGVCFTGSTATARRIQQALLTVDPPPRLIAETGGLNAMIVDSTALHEQAVRDIVDSAFRSAGQRCSALRMLYVQREVAPDLMTMLLGAMDALVVGDPWECATDVGPLINGAAKSDVDRYVDDARQAGKLIRQVAAATTGHFVGPALVRVDGIQDLVAAGEVFGPVLHVATFEVTALESVLDDINAAGYGLTFGLHTRIDDRVQRAVERVRAGNLYVNRNQIGAVVGVQPFGGEGLSGTGPKAGGPNYLSAFMAATPGHGVASTDPRPAADERAVRRALSGAQVLREPLDVRSMPGPTGESNRLYTYARGVVLCLGPGRDAALAQARSARGLGCGAVAVAEGLSSAEGVPGVLSPDQIATLEPVDVVICWSGEPRMAAFRAALAERHGPLVPMVVDRDLAAWCVVERHVCTDTTAAGGNASLLAGCE